MSDEKTSSRCCDSTTPTIPYNAVQTLSSSLKPSSDDMPNQDDEIKIPVDSEWAGFSAEIKLILQEIVDDEKSWTK